MCVCLLTTQSKPRHSSQVGNRHAISNVLLLPAKYTIAQCYDIIPNGPHSLTRFDLASIAINAAYFLHSSRDFCRKKSAKNRKKIIHRYLGEQQSDCPDVDTLGLSFATCKKIFVQLPLAEVYNCMVVCKEWRSLIDTCAFWRAYVAYHYDNSLRDPKRGTFMCLWKHNAPVCRGAFGTGTYGRQNGYPDVQEEYVFRPFPDVWRCGVVVPHSMLPAEGSIDTFHYYIQAMHWTQRVRWKIKSCKLQSQVRVCLFQWTRDRIATGKEVLDIYNAHEDIVRTSIETKDLTRSELKNCFTLLKDRFDYEFFSWFVDRVEYRSVVFDCSKEQVQPCPCFIITQVAPGWVGGLLYSV